MMPPTCGFWTAAHYTDTARSPKLAGQLCDGCGGPVTACEIVLHTREDSDTCKLYHVGCEPYVRSQDWKGVAS